MGGGKGGPDVSTKSSVAIRMAISGVSLGGRQSRIWNSLVKPRKGNGERMDK